MGSWSEPSLLFAPDEGDKQRAASFPKPEIVDGRALIPLEVTNESQNNFVNYTKYIAVQGPDTDGWAFTKLAEPQPMMAGFDYTIDANDAGTVAAVWSAPAGPNGTHKLHVRVSHDAARTWGPTHVLDTPGTALQPWVAVREDGLVGVSYHGSDHEGSPMEASSETAWWPRAVLFEAASPSDPYLVAQLNPVPIYEGMLCTEHNCPEEGGRTPMADFLSATWGPDGSFYTAFTNASVEDPGSPTNPFVGEDGRLTVTRLDVSGDVGTSDRIDASGGSRSVDGSPTVSSTR